MVGVIDYDAGNVKSVMKAVDKLGGNPVLTSDPKVLDGCSSLILPGVGSFGKAVQNLKAGELDRCIKKAVSDGRLLLGICLGMQMAVVEFARNVLGLKNANSSEFAPEGESPVIHWMPDQRGDIQMGGTMRLGAYPCVVMPGTKLEEAYHQPEVAERHRHRYEFNNSYRDKFLAGGMVFSGLSPDSRLVEAVELPDKKFFVGVQYHPEFKSRPNHAHPLFRELIRAALDEK